MTSRPWSTHAACVIGSGVALGAVLAVVASAAVCGTVATAQECWCNSTECEDYSCTKDAAGAGGIKVHDEACHSCPDAGCGKLVPDGHVKYNANSTPCSTTTSGNVLATWTKQFAFPDAGSDPPARPYRKVTWTPNLSGRFIGWPVGTAAACSPCDADDYIDAYVFVRYTVLAPADSAEGEECDKEVVPQSWGAAGMITRTAQSVCTTLSQGGANGSYPATLVICCDCEGESHKPKATIEVKYQVFNSGGLPIKGNTIIAAELTQDLWSCEPVPSCE